MFNELQPQKGSLLVSEPFMLDQNFKRSVILLADHNETDGTVGFILNQRTQLMLSDVFQDVEREADFPIYLGGPVECEALFFIHKAYDLLLSGEHIIDDVYWGGDIELLLRLAKEEKITSDEVKFFIGYSGWSPSQLDREIKENSWAVDNKFNKDLTFITDGEDLWKQALISMGQKYAHVANFPQSPELN
ncbi:YqgE/AlgH family protein [Sphingobacterium spiritivorum]|uniref:ACR, COG1678 n=2 Tax=Sphingobacterium spiritivorum TaxID=258 RepID=D7VSN2_SPHSI|nr:YqgE/AlgH family protein [Sphingobacterium spiritivorum]EEI90567.1 putative ACR, COG1678 [Sphingobacterium spiritivorum ATCC 33300]EFK56783.1 putative ACR, COG1678 [Sphingobacterium spiritivorum ATCC 33861]QQS95397.1 YqgE/AlgH family protein [Sphingobacterium spiritivorum]QQT35189.1 YqgE/AlgH family protein [Sphingobacterium spiritivorum]WQD36096.1 YqgE/AlgH family protein [Sphingobacterium spiritivorum]